MAEHLWDQPGVPHRGWTCVNIEDHEEPSETCEMCGKEEIRYVHTMRHPDYHKTLGVGSVCAEKMALDYKAKAAERWLKGRPGRRERFVESRWMVGRSGNAYKKHKGVLVEVGRGTFGYFANTNGLAVRGSFNTARDAKVAAFDMIDHQ